MVTNILFGRISASAEGLFSAIMSGLFLSMFFIGNKMANDRDIPPVTMLFYTTLAADLVAIPFADLGGTFEAISDPKGLALGLMLGVLLTLIPYYC